MGDSEPLGALSWWDGVSSCFQAGRRGRGCGSGALGVLSAVSLLLSCCVLLCHSCKLRACNTGSAVASGLYCLIGDLCNAAGSVLSHQLPLQIIMAFFMSTLDVFLFISVVFPYCWWRHSKTGRRVRMVSRRRRQNSLAVCLLFGMGGYVYLGKVAHHSQPLAGTSPTSRRLLSVFLHDHIELLGYVLGLVSFAIGWTSRFPFFLKASRGEVSNPLHVASRALSALAGAFYASAVLIYDTRLESIVRALPWILSGACCAILDVAILIISCYRIHYKCHLVRSLDSDAVSLLGRTLRPTSGQHHPKDRKHHLPARKSGCPKMTERGRYMDVNVQPVRKVCLKEVTITREGSADNQPLKRSVKVVRVDECYSSGSTTDSSSMSSELEEKANYVNLFTTADYGVGYSPVFGPPAVTLAAEFTGAPSLTIGNKPEAGLIWLFVFLSDAVLRWDFEEATPQWSSSNGDQQIPEAFPLQERMAEQRLKCDRSRFHACFCNSGGLEEQRVTASPDTN